MSVCLARFNINEKELKSGISSIISACHKCSDSEIEQLMQAGYIPRGIADFLMAVRANICFSAVTK